MNPRAVENLKFRGHPALTDLAFKSLPGAMSWDLVLIEENCMIVVHLMTNTFTVFPFHNDKNCSMSRQILSVDDNLPMKHSDHNFEEFNSKKRPIAIITETESELLIKYYGTNKRMNQMHEELIYRPKCHFGKEYEGKVIGCECHWLFVAYWKSKKSSWWPSRSTSDEITGVFVGSTPTPTLNGETETQLEEHKLELEGSWQLPFIVKVQQEHNISGNIGVLSQSLTLNFLSSAPHNQLLRIGGSIIRELVVPQAHFNAKSKQTIVELLPGDGNLFPPEGIWSWPQIFQNRTYYYIFVKHYDDREAVGELWSLGLNDFRWKKEKNEWRNMHIITSNRPILTVTESGSAFINLECSACCYQHVFQFDLGTPKKFAVDHGRKLGGGAFGNVFSGESQSAGHFAAKIIEIYNDRGSSLVAQQKLLLSAIDGARRLRSVLHANIIKGYGFFLENDRIVQFSELMAQTLLHVIKASGSVEEGHAIRVLLEISDALCYLHSFCPTPILHGDIKCANIFVSDDGIVKLGDFGIMLDVSISGTNQQLLDSGLMSSVIANKLHWMAPEVLEKETAYSRRADIWSLGCTMVEMLTGSPPYSNYSTFDWITAHHKRLLTCNVQQLVPNLSDDLSELLEQVFRRKTKTKTDESDSLRPSAGEILIRLKEIVIERELSQKRQEIDELRSAVLCGDYCSDDEYYNIPLS